MAKKYTISDGKLVLTLEEAENGWYAVTSPMDPAVHTQAKTIPEAFEMARDAIRELTEYRKTKAAPKRDRRAGA